MDKKIEISMLWQIYGALLTEKQKEYEKKVTTRDDIISNLAQLIIEQNEAMLGKDVAEKAKEKVRKEKKANVQ